MNRFSEKIAKEIAQKQFCYTLDCVLGSTDLDYTLGSEVHVFEANFEEDLQEKQINPTPVKIERINKHYQRLVDKASKYLRNLQK